jgi:hypothetical protein
MALKLAKFAVALLLGFILAAYPVVGMYGPSPVTKSCCHGGHCCKMGCCAAPQTPASPVNPAPAPSPSQQELQAPTLSLLSLLTPPLFTSKGQAAQFSSSVLMTAIPLFQRDCCYLI